MAETEKLSELRNFLNAQLIGQASLVDSLLVALLCDGHVLLEGFPGTAKTRAVRMLASCLSATMGRIQFTPDLLPSDVTGAEVYHQDMSHKLVFEPGPIFNHLLLADEINRAPAKVQSALLEAMAERQVTVAGETHQLPELFMVLATQNPIEQEGTYPLPEAQLDRFLMKVSLDYPDDDAELEILRLVKAEEIGSTLAAPPVMNQIDIMELRSDMADVYVSPSLESYIVQLIMASRKPQRYVDSKLGAWIALGASPRATIDLDKCARASALLAGRDHVMPHDIQVMLARVIGHRVSLSYKAQAEGVSGQQLADEILRQVAVA